MLYDVVVSWCGLRLLLQLKVCRDHKKVGKHWSRIVCTYVVCSLNIGVGEVLNL